MGVTKKIPFKKVHVEKNSFQCVVVSLSPRRHDIQTSQGFQCGIAKIVASLAISINRAKLSPLHKSLDVSSNHCFNFEQPVSSSWAYFFTDQIKCARSFYAADGLLQKYYYNYYNYTNKVIEWKVWMLRYRCCKFDFYDSNEEFQYTGIRNYNTLILPYGVIMVQMMPIWLNSKIRWTWILQPRINN